MMRCNKVKKLLEAYIEDELGESEQKAVEAHISSCQSCRQELELTRSIPGIVSSLSAPPAPEDIIPNTLRRLHEGSTAQPRWMRGIKIFLSWRWQFTATALVMIAALLFGIGYYKMNGGADKEVTTEPEITEIQVASAVEDVKLALGIVQIAMQEVELTTLKAGAEALNTTRARSIETMQTISNVRFETFSGLRRSLAVLNQLQIKEVQEQ